MSRALVPACGLGVCPGSYPVPCSPSGKRSVGVRSCYSFLQCLFILREVRYVCNPSAPGSTGGGTRQPLEAGGQLAGVFSKGIPSQNKLEDERAQTKRGEGKKGGKGDQLLNKCVWTQAQEHEKRMKGGDLLRDNIAEGLGPPFSTQCGLYSPILTAGTCQNGRQARPSQPVWAARSKQKREEEARVSADDRLGSTPVLSRELVRLQVQ